MLTGRFAPSPSGHMHLGNAFSALLCWLSVRSRGGRLLLRMEDLDPARCRPEYARALLDDLAWLGLDWDEYVPPARDTEAQGATEGGILYQSRRSAFYAAQLTRLKAQGLLYPCFCTRAQLHAASAPQAGAAPGVYNGRCRRLAARQVAAMLAQRPAAVRAAVPDEVISFCDGVQGPVRQHLATECGDFLLCRSDGVHAYQLAATADDGAAGITEVVRGRDLLDSTPRQIWLLRTLGYAVPQYYHVPLLLAADGRRLSKREGDLSLCALRGRGVQPQAIVGLLAHLAGLCPTPAPVAARQLLPSFDWSRVHKENRVFTEGLL
ncbi:tRNA glutamyl-Q(34) synthetase GluQRS [Ruminococcaceae bacterium OttesenSCG-928-O06]|nr:tRNA glutamyl-Q(34) synthetase GluQRS [Ruminococcaceae bacterium OttesenSCG-928-O06]